MKRVAIVEEDAVMACLYEEVCRTAGYEFVGWARDAHSAIAMIEREQPDYLLLEFAIGEHNLGLDLVEHLKPRCPSLFTIMITAWDINDIAVRIHGAQPDRILRKPVPADALLRVMASADSPWLTTVGTSANACFVH